MDNTAQTAPLHLPRAEPFTVKGLDPVTPAERFDTAMNQFRMSMGTEQTTESLAASAAFEPIFMKPALAEKTTPAPRPATTAAPVSSEPSSSFAIAAAGLTSSSLNALCAGGAMIYTLVGP